MQMGQSILKFIHAEPTAATPIQYTMHVADMVAPHWISVTLSTSETPQ